MISLKKFRKNPQEFFTLLQQKHINIKQLQDLQAYDQKIQFLINQEKEINTQKNHLAKTINNHYAQDNQDNKNITKSLEEKILTLKQKYQKTIEELNQTTLLFNQIYHTIPNPPDHNCPKGLSSKDNKIIKIKEYNNPKNFPLLTHDEISKSNIININKAQKITGSRFVVYNKYGSLLLNALINFTLSIQIKNNYIIQTPPVIVNKDSLFNTGQLPKFEEDLFKLNDNYYLSPTSEVQLVNLYKNQILDSKTLPIKLCANTPCFRQEAGSAGKDTKGFIRLHQFHKTELVVLCHPQQSDQLLMQMLEHVESILAKLKLTYRWVDLCTGDLGFSSSRTFDLEVWMPASNRWLEISSCSNTRDFQSRRAKIRFKENIDSKTELVHILNGSGVAIDRLMAAIIENYQNIDQKIDIPEALKIYFTPLNQI